MTLLESPPVQRLSVRRWVIAAAIGILLAADILAYGAARLFPRNVFLRSHFFDYVTGLGILATGLFIGSIVVFPVRNSAVQNVRQFVRLGMFFLTVAVLILAGFVHGFGFFTYRTHYVAATSPDGRLTAVMVTTNGKWDELHVFSGSGLGRTDLGDVGAPCALDKVFFTSDTDLTITSTNQTQVDIPLDPQTGKPLQVLQLTCPFEGA